MKAITVRQPWAWAIVHGGKRIENRRNWRYRYTGPIAIHAGRGWSKNGEHDPRVLEAWARVTPDPLYRNSLHFACGAIVAVAELVETHWSSACVRTATLSHLHPDGPYKCSPWADGGHGGCAHLVLADVRPLPEPIPARGQLGLWKPEPHVLDALAAVDR